MSEPPASLTAALSAAARATGVSLSYLTETARRESAFDAQAKAATSSASGLFQFIESTWLETLARHGADFGLDGESAARALKGDRAEKERSLALRFDPAAAALMAGVLTRSNADQLEAAIGRAPTDGELYAAHVLGAGGASRLIAAATDTPTAPAADLFPKAAAANHGLFFGADGRSLTAKGALERIAGKAASEPRPVSTPPATQATRRLFAAPAAPALRLTSTVIAALAMLDAPKRSGER